MSQESGKGSVYGRCWAAVVKESLQPLPGTVMPPLGTLFKTVDFKPFPLLTLPPQVNLLSGFLFPGEGEDPGNQAVVSERGVLCQAVEKITINSLFNNTFNVIVRLNAGGHKGAVSKPGKGIEFGMRAGTETSPYKGFHDFRWGEPGVHPLVMGQPILRMVGTVVKAVGSENPAQRGRIGKTVESLFNKELVSRAWIANSFSLAKVFGETVRPGKYDSRGNRGPGMGEPGVRLPESRRWSEDGHESARRVIKSFDQTFSKVWPPAGPPEAINKVERLYKDIRESTRDQEQRMVEISNRLAGLDRKIDILQSQPKRTGPFISANRKSKDGGYYDY